MILVFLTLMSFWAANWHLGGGTISLTLILSGYTLFLVLPIIRFKLGPSGFEGELKRLIEEKDKVPTSVKSIKEVEKDLAKFSEKTVEPDLLLMRLSVEIETTMRSIAQTSGLAPSLLKVGIGSLNRMLRQAEIITDPWLINAIQFFQTHRNALVHEGKTTDVKAAIEIGSVVLARLKEIKKRIEQQATGTQRNLSAK